MTDLNKILDDITDEIGGNNLMSQVYDYKISIKICIIDEIRCERTIEDFKEYGDIINAYDALYDDMWVSDGITGNASGSFTCNRWSAEKNICHNSELLYEAMRDMDAARYWFENHFDAEYADVTIRCYLLSECLYDVLEEIYERINSDD